MVRRVLILILFIAQSVGSPAAEEAPNLLRIKGGIEIELPLWPSDPTLKLAFEGLSPEEKRSFYLKRRYIMERLVGGLGRPGLRDGFRWIKNKVYSLVGRQGESTAATLELNWQKIPENLSVERKALIETAVSGLIENLWQNSSAIAKTNGLGLTFVGGGMVNTTIPQRGWVWGRGVSLDIGVDFKRETGYVRILKDAHRLRKPGLSFDVGPMFDVLLHVTNPDLDEHDRLQVNHIKLPMLGCFRSGVDYRAWGGQMGFNVLEMVGAWLVVMGMPMEGGALIAGTRTVGLATIYSTNLERRVLKRYSVSEIWMRRLGFGRIFDLSRELNQSCDSILK